jgi:hypothetical protein
VTTLGAIRSTPTLEVPVRHHPAHAARIAVVATALALLGPAPSAAAATPVPGDPLTGSGEVDRTALTVGDLTTGTAAAPVPAEAFALPDGAAPATHDVTGTLTLDPASPPPGFTALRDPYGYAGDPAVTRLPEFSVALVQHGSHLVPVDRGMRVTGSTAWNVAVAPGRAWHENGDGGWSRAALPFSLIERNANCVHHGVMTFLFTDAAVSQVRYQIASETCEYFQFDMWGQAGATHDPGVADAEAVREAYAAEVAERLPTKPIAELATDHPEAGVDLAAFGGGISPDALSTFGFFHEGVNYVGGCPTRQGEYPYCDRMLVPSYSTAKSAFGGLALLRLAQRFGPGVADEPMQAHVPELAGDPAWNGVTIRHALNMATGNYDSAQFERDEGGSTMLDFFLAESLAGKMSAALSFPRKAAPGSTWVYHTSDTFLATRAMAGVLASHEGAGADLFAMLRDEVLVPAGVGPDALTTLRTGNSATGTPFGGYGMFWTQDDIAKVAKLVTVDGGASGGEQLLHPGLLDATMQRDPADRGMTTTGSVPFRYNNAFWAREFTPADDPAYESAFHVPFMSGFGGITVALMPNGSTYYVFSDGNEFAWADVVAESHKLAPMTDGGGGGECTPGEAIADGGFEAGTAGPWTASPGVVDDREALQPARSGAWKAWLNGFGYANTESVGQTVTIPAGCTATALTFWLRIDTDETLANPYDTARLTADPSVGSPVTLAEWSNLDARDYALEEIGLGAFAGQAVTLTFTGSEDYSKQTSFVLDDVSVSLG